MLEESGRALFTLDRGFLVDLKTAQIASFSCWLSTSGLICLFVFIWKASAKTNKAKNKLSALETKLVENVLLCLSKIITLILLQSSTVFLSRVGKNGREVVLMSSCAFCRP